MPNKEKETQKSKPKPRSPAYPSIPLEEAIDRARQIYDHEQKTKRTSLLSLVTGTMQQKAEKLDSR